MNGSGLLSWQRPLAILFRHIATVRTDAPIGTSVDDIEWRGPRPEFPAVTRVLESPDLLRETEALAAATL